MAVKLDVDYLCPDCRSNIRVWKNIIFSVRSCADDRKGLLLLNPKLGNYEFISHHKLEFDRMDCLDYHCPVCGFNLIASDVNNTLARIIMVDKDQKEYDIYFSRIRGKESTFKVKDGDIVERYGRDSSGYVEYFMSRFRTEKVK